MSNHKPFIVREFFLCALLLAGVLTWSVGAQTQSPAAPPLTNEEFVRLVRQLPARPSMRDEIVTEVRRRGIGFPLTSGLRSLLATKSGNDALLRRTLEEAERRRVNPVAAALPSEAEGANVLAEARAATDAAVRAMPDFVVKQQVVRAYARGTTQNWKVDDRLTVAVSFRVKEGEQYRVLAVNGLPVTSDSPTSGNYTNLGGTSSTGEYVSRLAMLFAPESEAEFKMVDTDTLRGRRAIVYEYEIKRENSRATITYNNERSVIVGNRGRVWIDRETFRILRLEIISTDIAPDFPVTASSNAIDYDWVTIAERQYLLPVRAVLEMTAAQRGETFQTRNDIRFRGYQKFGTEVRVLEEDIIDEELEKKP